MDRVRFVFRASLASWRFGAEPLSLGQRPGALSRTAEPGNCFFGFFLGFVLFGWFFLLDSLSDALQMRPANLVPPSL